MIKKEDILRLNDEINNTANLVIAYKNGEIYLPWSNVEYEVNKVIKKYDEIRSSFLLNPGYMAAIKEMYLNIDFIINLAQNPNRTMNKYAVQCWRNGTPSPMCHLYAYKISREKLNYIIDNN